MSRLVSLSCRAFLPALVLGAALVSACDGSPTTPSKPTLLAVTTVSGSELGVVGLDGSGYTRLVGPALCNATSETCSDPAWTPDGKSILFTMGTRDPIGVHLHVVDLSGNVRRLVPPGGVLQEELWGRVSPDGQWVYLTARTEAEGFGVWRVALDGSSPTRVGPAPVPYGLGADRVYGVTPDGRRVLIESVRSGIQRLAFLELSTVILDDISASGSSVASSPAGARIARVEWESRHVIVQNLSGTLLRDVRDPDVEGGGFGNGLTWSADGDFLLAHGVGKWYRVDPAAGTLTAIPALGAYHEAVLSPVR